MTMGNLIDLALRVLNIFEFLRFIDEKYDARDPMCSNVVDTFFMTRYGWDRSKSHGVRPFVHLQTGITLLSPIFLFAHQIKQKEEWDKVDFKIKPEYDIKYIKKKSSGNNACLTVVEVISVLRNAIAHFPDFIAKPQDFANITFPKGSCVKFDTKSASVEFQSSNGYLEFLKDFLSAVRMLLLQRVVRLAIEESKR